MAFMQIADLPIASVDPGSPVPLYFQVESDLRRLMRGGELAPGESIPPEQELCQGYGVSRHTIRLALSRLAAENLISRGAGRGTFVLPGADRTRFFLDCSFTCQMAEMGRQAHSQVLHASTGRIDATYPPPLQTQAGAPCFHLERLRFGDDEPIGIQHLTIVTSCCPGLESFDFSESSVYEVLSRAYRLEIVEIQHMVGAAVADGEQAALLDVPPGSPLLVVNTTAFLENRQPIEFTSSCYRADRYEYSTRLYSRVSSTTDRRPPTAGL